MHMWNTRNPPMQLFSLVCAARWHSGSPLPGEQGEVAGAVTRTGSSVSSPTSKDAAELSIAGAVFKAELLRFKNDILPL